MCTAENIRLDNGKPDKILSGHRGNTMIQHYYARFSKTYITQELKLLFCSPGACNALNKLQFLTNICMPV